MTTSTLDAQIIELEQELGKGNFARDFSSEKFDRVLYEESYPKCVRKELEKENPILFGGIDFDKLTQTEIAIVFVRNFAGIDRWKEERERRKKEQESKIQIEEPIVGTQTGEHLPKRLSKVMLRKHEKKCGSTRKGGKDSRGNCRKTNSR